MIRLSSSRMMIHAPWKPDLAMEDLLDRWAMPPSTFVDVKGLKVHLRDEGPREDPVPIVLIHGTSSSLQTWEGWVAALKEQRRVITFDLPGFGLTGPNALDDYRIESYVLFVLDLLDMLGVQRCVLGGNSLGGDIAWHIAAAARERVARLILVDAAGYSLPEPKSIWFSLAKVPGLNQLLTFSMSRSLIESGLRKLYGDPSHVTREIVDRHVQLMRRQGNRRALVRAIQQSRIGEGAPLIKTIKQPTLIIWGGRDRMIPVDHASRFHKDIPQSRLQIFTDLGHMPQEEDPARTVPAVLEFIKIKLPDGSLNEEIRQTEGGPMRWRFFRELRAKMRGWIGR